MRKVVMWSAATLILALGVLTFTSLPVIGRRAKPAVDAVNAGTDATHLTTPWGEPNLQGIWMPEFMTPLERPDWVGGREFFTEDERRGLDERRAKRLGRDFRATRGTVADVSGAYSEVFRTRKRTGPRTSLIIDPSDGRLPSLTPDVQKKRQMWREYELMLLQASQACKDGENVCRGGKYGPPSPRFHDPAPIYPVNGVNRSDHPEDHGLIVRCLSGYIPGGGNAPGFPGADGAYNEVRRIVQTPGGLTMTYDVGQGQGFQRSIVMNGSPHLPSHVRQWWGDSRGRWDGSTLVIDITNFTYKVDFLGSRGTMHVVERYTRTGPDTIEYVATMEDPTTWTRPWTVTDTLHRQSEQENRIYAEPRCHEGNYGLPGLLRGARMEEQAYKQGRGPHPAEICQNGCNGVGEDAEDTVADFAPLQ